MTLRGGDSCTRIIYRRESIYYPFSILDTPGFGSQKMKLSHAAAITCALIEEPVSQIFVTLKFDRLSNMVNKLEVALAPI